MTLYEATIDTKWSDFTDEHQRIRNNLEQILLEYANGDLKNMIPIRGPYAQGKSTILIHLFRYAWENGIPAILTPLEKILPPNKMEAAKYSKFVKEEVYGEVKRIFATSNEISLIKQDAKEWIVNNILGNSQINIRENIAVLLVDEMEQYYKELLEKVPSDDRTPLKEFTQKKELLVIAAFGPTSMYEAMSSEAERRRWHPPFRIPPIKAFHLRKESEDYGNFAWWVGKGRPGYAFKVLDCDISSLENIRQFEHFAQQDIGEIEDTPSIELDILSRYFGARDFVREIYPHTQAEPKIPDGVCRGKILTSNEFLECVKKGLKRCAWLDREIERFCYYLDIIIDAISRDSQFLFPNARDGHDPERLKALFEIALDYAFDIEGGEIDPLMGGISEKLKNLSQDFQRFFYTELYNNLKIEALPEGAILSYDLIPELFPVPLVSPRIGDMDVNNARERILSSHPSGWWITLDRKDLPQGLIDIKIFINEEKLRGFLDSPDLMEYLHPSKGILCVLLQGNVRNTENTLSGFARWLYNDGRLRFDQPSALLSNFITTFIGFYCCDGLPAQELIEIMTNKKEEVFKTNKPLSRKIARNLKILMDFRDFAIRDMNLYRDKFSFIGDPRAIGEAAAQSRTLLPDFIALSFCSQHELDTVLEFKLLIESSEELKNLKTGFIWLLDKLSVGKKRPAKLSAPLRDVKSQFDTKKQNLTVLAQFIEEENFKNLAENDVSREVLRGIYKYIKMSTYINKNENLQRADDLITRIDNLRTERETLSRNIEISIRESRSERSRSKLDNIKNIVARSGDYVSYFISLLTRDLLQKFDDELLSRDENFIRFWKDHENSFVQFKEKVENVNTFESGVFTWLGKSKDSFIEEVNRNYSFLLIKLTNNQPAMELYEYENMEWDAFEENIVKLIESIETLKSVATNANRLKNIAEDISQMLQNLHKSRGGGV